MHSPRPRLQDVRRLLRQAQERRLTPAAVRRLRWMLFALEHGGNISLTCRHFGIARSTYTRWASRFDTRKETSLDDSSRRPHTVRAPETQKRTITLIKKLRTEQPLLSKEQIAEDLKERGVHISAATVGRIIERHGFFFADTPLHRRKRAEQTSKEDDNTAPHTPRTLREGGAVSFPLHTGLEPLSS